MIKFFRKIRYKALSQNRFTRYLLYAIGEIVLVVIGILIALEINNRNELHKNEQITILALKEVQNNLLQDIEEAQKNLDDYLKSYITFHKTFDYENPWTHEDFKMGEFESLGNLYIDYDISKSGYNNLVRQLDRMPEKYKPILNDLRILYVDLNENIQVSNQRIRSTVYSNLDYMHSQNWGIDRRKNLVISNEEMDYFVNDDAYKRQVLKFMNDRNIVFRNSQRYRVKAIETYIKIDSMLNKKETELPYKLLGKIKSKREVEQYIGTYKYVDSTIPVSIKLFYKNHHFFSVANFEDTLKHYRIDDKRYFWMGSDGFSGYPAVWKIIENKDGDIGVKFLNQPAPNLVKVD